MPTTIKRESPQVNRALLMQKVQEIINANTDDPAAEMRAMGKALTEIGQTLDGISATDARAILTAVQALN